MPIPKRLRRTLLQRGLILWILSRLVAVGVIAVAASGSGGASAVLVPLWTMTMCAVLFIVDLHRRREVLLLQNLGITKGGAVAIGALPAILLEALLVAVPG